MNKDTEPKISFICTGRDEDYSVDWFNTTNSSEDAKTSPRGNTLFIMVNDDGRTIAETNDLMYVIELAKRKTYPKGRGKQSIGKVYVYWVGKDTNKEYLMAVVTHTVTRRFRPIYPKRK